jgi:hypothetical protein
MLGLASDAFTISIIRVPAAPSLKLREKLPAEAGTRTQREKGEKIFAGVPPSGESLGAGLRPRDDPDGRRYILTSNIFPFSFSSSRSFVH